MSYIPSLELHESYAEPTQTNAQPQHETTEPNSSPQNRSDQLQSSETPSKKATNKLFNPASVTTAATFEPKSSVQGPTIASMPPASIDILIKEKQSQHEISQEIPDHNSLDKSLSMIQSNNNQGIPMLDPESDIPSNLLPNNNNDQAITVIELVIPAEQTNPEVNQNPEVHRLSKYTLKQIMEFYVLMAFVYALSFFSAKGKIPYSVLLIFLSFVCFTNIVRNLFCGGSCNQRCYKLVDWISISLVVSSSLAHITVDNNLPLVPFVAPGFLSTFFFCKFAQPTSFYLKKENLIILRFLFWTQILLVALKVDGKIGSWNLVFLMLFYLFVFIMSFSVGIFLIATIYICQVMPIRPIDHRVLGLIWDFLNTLLAWIWGFGTLGLIDKLEGISQDSLLNVYLLLGFIHIAVLILYTVIFRKSLMMHLETNLGMTNANEGEHTGPHRYIFQTVKENISYLVRVSSTYFTRKEGGFKVQDKEEAQKWRQQILHAKLDKHHKTVKWDLKENTGNENIEQPEIEIEVKKSKKTPPHKNRSFFATRKSVNDFESFYNKADVAAKMSCYSQDDIDILGDIKRPSLRALERYDDRDMEGQCAVCFSADANAVIMECGHGGICYECAVEIWKRGENCVFCRKDIKEILKVSYVPGMDVAKIIEGTKKSIVFD